MAGQGWGWQLGGQYRAAQQLYKCRENRFLPVAAPSLATVGLMSGQVCPEDGQGQCLLLVDPDKTGAYVASHASNYTTPTNQARTNAVSNFKILEQTGGGYAEAGYRADRFYALAGLRYEHTDLDVTNYTPSPFTSLTSFVPIKVSSSYGKALPTLNVSYDITPQARIKAAITQTLARPTYSNLGSSSVPTLGSGGYTQTLANPNLKPREATNYDLSFELYPARGAVVAVAAFYKDLKNEIVSLTSTQNVNIQGVGVQSVLVSQTQNAGNARVEGIEVNVSEASLGFINPRLRYFGVSANVTLIGMDAPVIRMSNGTFRQLPQLLESGKLTSNINVFFAWRRYSGQLAYNHTDQMPISFDTNNLVNDQWYRGLDTLDGQLKVKLWPGVAATLEGKNLTNARPEKIVGPFQNLNYSLLNNGRAYYAGVNFAF